MNIKQDQLISNLSYCPTTGEWSAKKMVTSRKRLSNIGNVDSKGYLQIFVSGKLYLAHRLAFLYMNGYIPQGHIDHINGDRQDNRWCNLREVIKVENARNRKIPVTNTSGCIGVIRNKRDKAWQVKIGDGDKRHTKWFSDSKYGGEFLAFMAASFFSVNKRLELGYHCNHGRSV